ncbi:hypothetical protein MMC25_005751 [Agyrium rufum]|nr:hypothetical protein [Agyrium rufum]
MNSAPFTHPEHHLSLSFPFFIRSETPKYPSSPILQTLQRLQKIQEMQLRKSINTPRRFADGPNPNHTHTHHTFTSPRCTRPAFPSPYVDFDPNLPPAAFPTLTPTEAARKLLRRIGLDEERRKKKERLGRQLEEGEREERRKDIRNGNGNGIEHEIEHEVEIGKKKGVPMPIQIQTQVQAQQFGKVDSHAGKRALWNKIVTAPGINESDVHALRDQNPNKGLTDRTVASAQSRSTSLRKSVLRSNTMNVDPMTGRIIGRLLEWREPNPIGYDPQWSNDIENSVYADNIKKIKTFAREGSANVFVRQCEVGEDDDGEKEKSDGLEQDDTQDEGTNTTWDDLTPALQLEIATNLAETSSFTEMASRLGLSKDQQVKLIALSREYNARFDAEERILASIRANMHDASLSRVAVRMDDTVSDRGRVPQLTYNMAIDKHVKELGAASGGGDGCERRFDLFVVSRADLKKAHGFLEGRGLGAEIAGEWGYGVPYGGNRNLGGGESGESEIANVHDSSRNADGQGLRSDGITSSVSARSDRALDNDVYQDLTMSDGANKRTYGNYRRSSAGERPQTRLSHAAAHAPHPQVRRRDPTQIDNRHDVPSRSGKIRADAPGSKPPQQRGAPTKKTFPKQTVQQPRQQQQLQKQIPKEPPNAADPPRKRARQDTALQIGRTPSSDNTDPIGRLQQRVPSPTGSTTSAVARGAGDRAMRSQEARRLPARYSDPQVELIDPAPMSGRRGLRGGGDDDGDGDGGDGDGGGRTGRLFGDEIDLMRMRERHQGNDLQGRSMLDDGRRAESRDVEGTIGHDRKERADSTMPTVLTTPVKRKYTKKDPYYWGVKRGWSSKRIGG